MPLADPTTQDQPADPSSDEPDSSPAQGNSLDNLHVEVIHHTDVVDAQIDGWLDPLILRAIQLCGITHAQINIVVVADQEMAQLHEQYTGVAGTTDVLTFDMAEDAAPPDPTLNNPTIEGDIIVCLDEAKRQAQERGHETRHELLLYAVHGLMHLLGEDDHDEDDYQRMHAREDALLQSLGIGPLFHKNHPPPADQSDSSL